MSFWGRIFRRPAASKRRRRLRASYDAARVTRLTADWGTTSVSSDSELRYALPILRARARDLEQNNAYAKKFLALVEMNVIGAHGVVLQNKATRPTGELDTLANDKIETAWRAWGSRGACDVTGRHSWVEIERQVIKAVARDGEVLVRLIRNADTPHRLAVEVKEADYLDHTKNVDQPGANRISMGVEVDGWGRRVAYHLHRNHPGDLIHSRDRRETVRVPAEEILHLYRPERPTQLRGVPWMHAAMGALKQLGAFEEAAVVAARVGASKMGFFTSESGEEYTGDDPDAEAAPVTTSAEPASFEQLPPGFGFQEFSPDYPHAIFAPFVKRALQSIASGINVSYLSLSSDLEGTSFSSGRIGLLEERERWKVLQDWIISSLHAPVFEAWLDLALLSGAVNLPPSGFDRFHAPTWQPRTWDWVDPVKDMAAMKMAKDELFKAPSTIVAEQGGDYEELCRQIQRDREIRERYGITDDDQPQEVAADG